MSKLSLELFVLGLCLSTFMSGCQRDLDIRERTFYCSDDRDCLNGFVCRAYAGDDKACVKPPISTDTASADTGSDAGNGKSCEGEDFEMCSSGCQDLTSDTQHCGKCGNECWSGETCANGECVDAGACPIARIMAREFQSTDEDSGAEVSVSTTVWRTIELNASPSYVDDGQITNFEWILADKPYASSSKILDADAEEATLFTDVYGEYEVLLNVTDSNGTQSCASAAAIITADPEEDVAIQLTWGLLADSDQPPADNADLDLHYAYGNSDWDSFGDEGAAWTSNYNPDWGAAGEYGDNPLVIGDVSDHPSVEHLHHSNLVSHQTYRVGVHSSFHPDSPRVIDALVTVYIEGVLAYSKNNHLEGEGQFWDVGRIAGDSLDFEPTNQLHDGFPSP